MADASGFGFFWLEQVEGGAFDSERDKARVRAAGVVLSGIPANAPPAGDRHSLAIWPGRPALACYDQKKLCVRSRMRSDDAAWSDGQASQMHLAPAPRDACGV